MTYYTLIEAISVQRARLRSQRHNPDLVVYMNPLDEMYLRGWMHIDLPLTTFMQMKLEIRENVPAGEPVVTFAPVDITARYPGDNLLSLPS